jgi:hypothetical protein
MYIDFDFPLQILEENREIVVLENSEVNITSPFLAPEHNHKYVFRLSSPDSTNWTNTIKPLKLIVRGDRRINFEAQDTETNRTFTATTNLKTRKPSRISSTVTPVALAPRTPVDYSELGHLVAMLFIYFIIMCISEILRYFTNKD